MASRTFHFKKFSVVDGDIKIHVDLSRFDKQFQQAQFALDGQVMDSMVPFMPKVTGDFIDVTKKASAAIQGSGGVYAGFGPQARYLYEGKVMVDSKTGKGPRKIPTGPGEYLLRFRKGAKLVPTSRPLKYTGRDYTGPHPNVTDHWFDAAKKINLEKWVNMVKRIAGGGKRG